MHFDSLEAFLHMGGHALYVWLAFGVTVAVLLVYTLVLRATRRRVLEELRWQADVASRE